MNFSSSNGTHAGARNRSILAMGQQEREPRLMDRQQQQDNGTHEFQPPQQGDGFTIADDSRHTLGAYLERASTRGDLPMPRTHAPDDGKSASRPSLWLAK